MSDLEQIKLIVESVERDRLERAMVKKAGVDRSGFLAHRALYPITSLFAIVTLGICSALVAMLLNFALIVWVFHLSFE